MSKDLDRVIEYAKQQIEYWTEHADSVHARIAMKDIVYFCHELKSEQPKPKDGNECIGMEVRYVGKTYPAFTNNEWYPCVGNYNGLCAFIDNNGTKAGCHPCNQLSFDIDNPRPIQNK